MEFPNTLPNEIPLPRGRSRARIREVIELLGVYPNIGREGALAGTRELVVPGLPYIVVHRIEGGDDPAVIILGIYHGARLRPGQETR